MLIPIDRLYNFLDGISNYNLVIYRWFPHGSKKLKDLLKIKNYSKFYEMINPQVIFHDQEPLQFDYYSFDEVFDRLVVGTELIGVTCSSEIKDYFKKISNYNIRAVVSGLNLYDKVLLVHSEKNSKNLKKYQQVNLIPVYYWSHALIARDWYRYAEVDPELTNKNFNFDIDFLVYNRSWSGTREYRLKFAEMIVQSGLDKNCHMNFSPTESNKHYRDHVFANSELSISSTNFEKYFNSNTASSDSSADYNSCDYQRCGMEIVLETLYDDDRQHLTEKSLRPIACGHPFIIVGTPGSLKYLHSYGFQTFGQFIDESYDQIADPAQRLTAIINLMSTLAAMPADQKQKLYRDMQTVCEFNRKRFFSNEFFQSVVAEYKENLTNGIQQLKMQVDAIEQELLFKEILLHNQKFNDL